MNLKSCGGQRVIQYETVCLERLMTERLNGSPMEASSSRAAEAGKPAAQFTGPSTSHQSGLSCTGCESPGVGGCLGKSPETGWPHRWFYNNIILATLTLFAKKIKDFHVCWQNVKIPWTRRRLIHDFRPSGTMWIIGLFCFLYKSNRFCVLGRSWHISYLMQILCIFLFSAFTHIQFWDFAFPTCWFEKLYKNWDGPPGTPFLHKPTNNIYGYPKSGTTQKGSFWHRLFNCDMKGD